MFYDKIGENDDAAGFALLGLVFVGTPITVAVFAPLMRELIIKKGEQS
jgi:hypothetical protein